MRLIPILTAAAVCLATLSWVNVSTGQNLRDDSLDKRDVSASVSVNAMLITASNEEGETDPRLAFIATNLKRNLRFEKFGYVGEGSARITMPGDAEIALPLQQTVKVEAAHYGEGMVWLRVIWNADGRQIMNVVYAKCPRGRPIVIGGGEHGGETLAIIVTPR